MSLVRSSGCDWIDLGAGHGGGFERSNRLTHWVALLHGHGAGMQPKAEAKQLSLVGLEGIPPMRIGWRTVQGNDADEIGLASY
ncbi:MAG TPA: hypothetical protein VFH49_04055, partial [Aquabacterium sp.]|nr:hypothetical protein [Aquabacterium sp.]